MLCLRRVGFCSSFVDACISLLCWAKFEIVPGCGIICCGVSWQASQPDELTIDEQEMLEVIEDGDMEDWVKVTAADTNTAPTHINNRAHKHCTGISQYVMFTLLNSSVRIKVQKRSGTS